MTGAAQRAAVAHPVAVAHGVTAAHHAMVAHRAAVAHPAAVAHLAVVARRAAVAHRAITITAALAFALAATVLRVAQASPAQDYMLHCMGCHGTQAQGVPGKIPPLANSLSRFMRTVEGRNYVLRVPGAANSALSDRQLAAVLNWLAGTFDASSAASSPAPFTSEEVSRLRRKPLVAVLAARRAVVRELAATGSAPPAQY
jgi:mono/diheme cytochrome c family protein